MCFCEFLKATGHELYVEALEKQNWQLITDFSTRYAELLKHYYVIGGMPEAVSTYLDTRDFFQVRAIQ